MSIREQIRGYIVDTLLSGDARGFSDDTDLQQTGILDSFATVELVTFLRETFEVRLDPDQLDADCFENVSSLTALIERCKRA